MSRNLRRRYWLEITLAVVAGVLAILTLITREWIEILFGVDPDGGNGSLEWALVAILAGAAVASALAARHEWVRALHATG